jgi:hypothetical protein
MRYETGEHWLLRDTSVIETLTLIMWFCHSLDKSTFVAGNMVAYNANGVVSPHFWTIAALAAHVHCHVAVVIWSLEMAVSVATE